MYKQSMGITHVNAVNGRKRRKGEISRRTPPAPHCIVCRCEKFIPETSRAAI